MEKREHGRVTEFMYDTMDDAEAAATKQASASMSMTVPVVVFKQGNRINMAGALHFGLIKTLLQSRSAEKRALISETTTSMNRPFQKEHAQAIATYIRENQSKNYILPPMTLNVQNKLNLFSINTPSEIRQGYLVVPLMATMTITDGQHRKEAISMALDEIPEEDLGMLQSDAISVMITCEQDIHQIHQDFADCSKTKPLAASLLAVYDRRNPANKIILDLEESCPLFRGKIDATSTTLSKKSPALFLANHIRQLVKTLLIGNWQAGDEVFQNRAKEYLIPDEAYRAKFEQFSGYINYLTERIPVWREISNIKPRQTSIIPGRREQGWVCLSVVGLVILGTIGHELFRKTVSDPGTDWKFYADKLGALDWRKSSELWKGNIIIDGKIIVHQKHMREGIKRIREAIGWDPELGSPKIVSEMKIQSGT
jgi:DNA sulfur modification protein DndB